MKIATVSLNQIWKDKNSNLKNSTKYIKLASKNKVDLIIFPEMTLTGFSTDVNVISETFKDSFTILSFQTLAKKYNIAVIFGVVLTHKHKTFNKAIFINKKGSILNRYIKIHPFSLTKEEKFFKAGERLEIVKFKNLKIGLTICYDLRFPELYTAYSDKNSDIIINIANWPKKRVKHWNSLLKARAIENQMFIIGVNRVGVDGNNLEYKESSNIYNANGEKLNYLLYKEMKIFKINQKWTKEFKKRFNTTHDRKLELYRSFYAKK